MAITPASPTGLPLRSFSLFFLAGVAPGAQTESKSAAAAKELAQLLEAAKLDSVASKDPAEKDRFVAALYFTGQLLVGPAIPAPTLLPRRSRKELPGRLHRLEQRLDRRLEGLHRGPQRRRPRPKRDNDQPFDTVEHGTQRLALDGEWSKQKLTEADYMKDFGEMDEPLFENAGGPARGDQETRLSKIGRLTDWKE